MVHGVNPIFKNAVLEIEAFYLCEQSNSWNIYIGIDSEWLWFFISNPSPFSLSLFIYLCNSRSSLDQLQKQNKQKTVDKSDIEQIF